MNAEDESAKSCAINHCLSIHARARDGAQKYIREKGDCAPGAGHRLSLAPQQRVFGEFLERTPCDVDNSSAGLQ